MDKATARRRELDRMAPVRGEQTRDEYGEIRCLAVSDGYVMCRRPGMAPFLLGVREWAGLVRAAEGQADGATAGDTTRA